jgi:N-formylglutamate amidohydrolase
LEGDLGDSFEIIRRKSLQNAIVFASPHSGRQYSDGFLAQTILNAHMIRSSEDAYVDQLFGDAPQFGSPLLRALYPRAYVDLNRAADELDPALIDGAPRTPHNPRIASGLGVIPRVVAGGRAIYSGKIPLSQAQRRLELAWHPYHNALRSLLNETHRAFGQVVLLDCHSMPHEAIEMYQRHTSPKPEIVLGDRHGAAARSDVTDMIEGAFQSAGFRVARNAPFAGAYIVHSYGRPSSRRDVVQIEIDRSLYMDEARIVPLPEFAQVQQRISQAISIITAWGSNEMPLAAE